MDPSPSEGSDADLPGPTQAQPVTAAATQDMTATLGASPDAVVAPPLQDEGEGSLLAANHSTSGWQVSPKRVCGPVQPRPAQERRPLPHHAPFR